MRDSSIVMFIAVQRHCHAKLLTTTKVIVQDHRIFLVLPQLYVSRQVAENLFLDPEVSTDIVDLKKGEYVRIIDAEDPQFGMYDKPLRCFGCGIRWFSYYATILYFGNYYHKDPRERSGLAASAIAVSMTLNDWCFVHFQGL
ncbi:hypothetical protein JRO89_XS09G0224000 [Xanthoceras sorbifolium]|uniref:Uncharacterized protein n=1 Tax=Xanthoceras sorbifolium TaxID=99658 RepID=A0ABQ8HMH4_9ROSI|nr:hypothetical protein JRO89_XS09G0224000 [Xanthoceras sorbifolium]